MYAFSTALAALAARPPYPHFGLAAAGLILFGLACAYWDYRVHIRRKK